MEQLFLKPGSAAYIYFLCSNMALLSRGVAPPLDSRGVSPDERPRLEILIMKRLSESIWCELGACPAWRASRADSSPFGPHLKPVLPIFPPFTENCVYVSVFSYNIYKKKGRKV